MKNNQESVKFFIIQALRSNLKHYEDFLVLQRKVCKQYKIKHPFSNITILKEYKKLVKQGRIKIDIGFEKLLIKRAVRTLSGVAVIAVMTKSANCPGNCLYCPTEKNMPKSYLSNEPAVMRAIHNNFDPYLQVKNRLKALHMTGHSTDKCELIVIGGTWSALSRQYQTNFIKRCFDGFNNSKSKNLEMSKLKNQKAKNRVIGLTLETRPDYIDKKEIVRMRKLGATRVEIGVQITDDTILKKNRRGHSVQHTIKATRLLKQAGFKVTYHFMPNLYGSTTSKDLKSYKELFSNPDFQPDQVKIYPCVVTKNSKLYKLFLTKKYMPYSDRVLKKLLIDIKKATPSYVRIVRLIRDIPEESIEGGNRITNLRQIIQDEFFVCKCIRCREARNKKVSKKDVILRKKEYKSSHGKEIFLSYESRDKKVLYAFLRLRLQKNINWYPVLKNAAIIRELHTYGELIPLKSKTKKVQHTGLGKKLIAEAEKVSKNQGYNRIAVIAGVGVMEYYKKLGYQLEDEYMVKNLTKL